MEASGDPTSKLLVFGSAEREVDRVTHMAEYDVIVLGGGLAGLCLSIQLKRSVPEARVLILEKADAPRPEAAHKVGESSVEVASHYFRNVLGVTDLLAKELPKFGLRFFLSEGENREISRRLECGPKHFLTIPSYQIDRGQFENGLIRRAGELGVEVLGGARVTGVDLAGSDDGAASVAGVGGEQGPAGEGLHKVHLTRHGEPREVSGRWVVDASGRAALLKKKLGLARSSRHDVNAAWFRIDHPIDLDDWSQDPAWRARLDGSRRLSTNHLVGNGYWVWLIPLANDRTSVGIVAAEALHPFEGICNFDNAMTWLEAHEPQCGAIVREHEAKRMDFLALKHYSHETKQMFSANRWCLTGDAGIFVDPFYSPGSDFVGMANSYVCDLIQRDLRGEAIDDIAAAHDTAYRSLAQTYLVTYYRQYPLMGHPRVMVTKIVWDFVMYWGGVAMLFCGGRMCDPEFMERARPLLQGFAFTNISMQAFFRKWASLSENQAPPVGAFVDYAGLDFLAELNANLQREFDDDALIAQMERNLRLARDLKSEITHEAGRTSRDTLKEGPAPVTGHLDKMFDLIRSQSPGTD